MGATSVSTVTLQNELDQVRIFGDLSPIFNVAGSENQPFLTICNLVMNAIFAVSFPHKWNEMILPQFYTNSYQQDYAGIYPSGASILNLSWLERGIVIDINNTAQPKPYRLVETGRQLPQALGSLWSFGPFLGNPAFITNFFPNSSLYYGTWGDFNTGNNTSGNNPFMGSVYINPLGSNSMPNDPITQIQDANGNLLVLTTYGVEGSAAPLLPANSVAGTTVSGSGATTVWTVVDPQGQGFRILPVPCQTGTVWQFNLVGQGKPPRFSSSVSLSNQYLTPLPDEFEPHFFAGVVAQAYRFSPEAKIREKFKTEWALWLASLNELRAKSDREQEENMFVPERGIMGTRVRTGWYGPGYPFNNPGSL